MQGSTFFFTVKMEIPDATTPTIGPQSPPTTIAEGITTRKKILLVDDNPVNQKVMVKTLMKLGFKNIEVASDGRQGIATYNKGVLTRRIFSPVDSVICWIVTNF